MRKELVHQTTNFTEANVFYKPIVCTKLERRNTSALQPLGPSHVCTCLCTCKVSNFLCLQNKNSLVWPPWRKVSPIVSSHWKQQNKSITTDIRKCPHYCILTPLNSILHNARQQCTTFNSKVHVHAWNTYLKIGRTPNSINYWVGTSASRICGRSSRNRAFISFFETYVWIS